ncbi:MAG: hypothetical protein Q8Q67_01920 [bacterium]|nr:hypothetical protein [bacterium]
MTHLSKHWYRILIFSVGVIATISYRLVIVVNHYSAFWVEVLWYIGTLGFIWYFAHRWQVERRRDKLIEDLNLTNKIANQQPLNSEEREALIYILKSLTTSLAKWNYIAIFFFSFLAIIYAVYAYFAG